MIQFSEIENIREFVLSVTKAKDTSRKSVRLIEEFVKRVIDESNPLQALNWIRKESHDLGESGELDDLVESVTTNSFIIGIMVSWIISARHDLLKKYQKQQKQITSGITASCPTNPFGGERDEVGLI
jgi:hypothetical protein